MGRFSTFWMDKVISRAVMEIKSITREDRNHSLLSKQGFFDFPDYMVRNGLWYRRLFSLIHFVPPVWRETKENKPDLVPLLKTTHCKYWLEGPNSENTTGNHTAPPPPQPQPQPTPLHYHPRPQIRLHSVSHSFCSWQKASLSIYDFRWNNNNLGKISERYRYAIVYKSLFSCAMSMLFDTW